MSREVDISDSWEDIDESELEKRLREEKIKREQEMSAATNQNGLLVTNGGDNFRPRIQVLQRPAQPPIKILKRPESSSSAAAGQQKSNSKPQIKTLEQREKEYAEARLRILGSSETTATTTTTFPSDPKLSPTSSVNSLQAYSQQQQQRIPDNIIRQPRGPTGGGGSGFNIRR